MVVNGKIPSSTLNKKHNSVAYHKTREAIAAGTIRLIKEPSETNLADDPTKSLSGPRMKFLVPKILF